MPSGPSTAPPDLVVVRGEDRPVPDADPPGSTPVARISDTTTGGVFCSIARTTTGVRLRWPRRCSMDADPEVRLIQVHHEPGTGEEMVGVLLAGTVVTLHLLLAGRLVLHASAVEAAGEALAFAGGIGAGKSTVAALFARAGHPIVTDDVLHVASTGADGAVVHRGGVELRLRDRVASLADGAGARTTEDGRTAVDLPMTASETLPLRACLLVRPSTDADRVSLTRLGPVEGVHALLRSPRLAGLASGEILAQQFRLTGDLVSTTPVFLADVPWGPPFDPTVPEQVLEGLSAAAST